MGGESAGRYHHIRRRAPRLLLRGVSALVPDGRGARGAGAHRLCKFAFGQKIIPPLQPRHRHLHLPPPSLCPPSLSLTPLSLPLLLQLPILCLTCPTLSSPVEAFTIPSARAVLKFFLSSHRFPLTPLTAGPDHLHLLSFHIKYHLAEPESNIRSHGQVSHPAMLFMEFMRLRNLNANLF